MKESVIAQMIGLGVEILSDRAGYPIYRSDVSERKNSQTSVIVWETENPSRAVTVFCDAAQEKVFVK